MSTPHYATKIRVDLYAILPFQASAFQCAKVCGKGLYDLDQVGHLCGECLEALLGVHPQLGQLLREGQQLIGENKAAQFVPPLRSFLEYTDEVAEFFHCKGHKTFLVSAVCHICRRQEEPYVQGMGTAQPYLVSATALH